MTYRVAINGFGRVGRNYLRAAVERGVLDGRIEVVAVNDVRAAPVLASLLAHDSTFGALRRPVEIMSDSEGTALFVAGQRIRLVDETDSAALPWKRLRIDLVLESTGLPTTRDDAAAHLAAGAGRVLLSSPGPGNEPCVVLGVSDHGFLDRAHEVISAASAATNCVAPMVQVLHRAFGLRRGCLTTIHASANDEPMVDGRHEDPRRARAAALNLIPTITSAAEAVVRVLPEMSGRLRSAAVRVPVENGSLADLTVELERSVTVGEVNQAFAAAARGRLNGVLRCSDAPLVSRDVIGDPSSCILDAPLTLADADLVKVFGWYDNEWGSTNRLLDITELLSA
jgi:glyceraldehyde 3-phosphate dehydrogenase